MIQAIRNVLGNMHIFFLSKSPQQRLISLYRAEAFLAQVSMNIGRSGHGSARGNMQTLLRKPESTTMPPQSLYEQVKCTLPPHTLLWEKCFW